MKKRILSIVLTAVILISTLFVSAVSALALGDMDGDGKILATDARFVLRAAVDLEKLTDEQKKAADVDYNGSVTAADARLILRASVGLEELKSNEHPEQHIFETISTEKATKCSYEGCDAELPAFNDIVNVLKSTENGVNYHTGFVESITHNDKMDISGPLASIMDDETNVASTETSYSALLVDRLLTPANFPANGAAYVSSLSDKDIKSIKIEKADTVDFVSSLPDSYTAGRTVYDLTPIKTAEFPAVYKATVVLPSQSFDIKKPVSGASVYDKIYMDNYNKKLEEMRSGIGNDLDSMSKEMESIGISISTSGTIMSSLTVEYFINAETLEPVAAKYLSRFDVDFTAKVPLMVTMKQTMYMTSNSYYFFNNNFGIEA